ncbi:MAG: primosomal protein N', partial [Rickettsiales bacterium]|nr:primosomal protein N' [Rickettsiales bacterium]
MFKSGDTVKVLIPNVVNTGYDYKLAANAGLGDFVRVSVMNRPYIGVIIGPGDSGLASNKIKPVQQVYSFPPMSGSDLQWISKMADWTMMAPGAVLRLIVNVPDAFMPPKQEELYSVNPGKNIRITETRQAVLDAFLSNDNEPMSVSDIQNIAHVSAAVARNMIKSGLLTLRDTRDVVRSDNFKYNYVDTGTVVLNNEQQLAADEIGKHIKADSGDFSVHLLDGITGSGKTQVYFDSAWRAYAAGKSVLLMMPEIALTAQFMSRFASRFGDKPVVWHSNLTAARRREIWRGVANGDIRMVVGTRSALFLPWQNLGLIVVDEEHDGSYKQEDMGNYHARDMAVLRGAISRFPIVLASATPSAETIKNVNAGKYKELKLTSRFGGAQMPSIETIDMRGEKSESYIIDGQTQGGNISPTLA